MNDQTRLINDVAIKLAKIRFSQKLKQSSVILYHLNIKRKLSFIYNNDK